MRARSIEELISLKGRRALVTGANGHLGKEISYTLAELGADLVLLDLPNTNFQKIIENLTKINKNINIEIIDCDLEDESSRNDLIEKINQEGKSLDILVNNAAFVGSTNISGWSEDFENQSLESWRRAIEVNVTSVFHLTKGLATSLIRSNHNSIINIASIYGVVAPNYSIYKNTPIANPSAYAVSKAGVIHLTKWLSTTLAPDIRVNSISPGGVYNDNLPEIFVKQYSEKVPMERMASSEDIKGAISFLATDLSSYITGQNIIVDGGWTVQ